MNKRELNQYIHEALTSLVRESTIATETPNGSGASGLALSQEELLKAFEGTGIVVKEDTIDVEDQSVSSDRYIGTATQLAQLTFVFDYETFDGDQPEGNIVQTIKQIMNFDSDVKEVNVNMERGVVRVTFKPNIKELHLE